MILEGNRRMAEMLDFGQIAGIIPFIQQAERIFVVGAGRSGLSMRSAAMRLMHAGYTVFVVGEITTPAIGKGDLQITASGSGTTGSIVKAADPAAAAKALREALDAVN